MTETIAYLREFHFASVVLRLALAMLLGGCIGLERERRPSGGVPHLYAGVSGRGTDRAAQSV